jgi:hypothetical protein
VASKACHLLFQDSSTVVREVLSEMSQSIPQAVNAPTMDVDLDDFLAPINDLRENNSDWITEKDQGLDDLYDDLADGIHEIDHPQFFQTCVYLVATVPCSLFTSLQSLGWQVSL